MSKDFIDLGRKYESNMVTASDKPHKERERVDYPTLYIHHGPEGRSLDDMEEEGEAIIKYKLKKYTEDVENDSCSCELSITGIKPLNKKQKKAKSSEESLSEAFDKVAKNKSK